MVIGNGLVAKAFNEFYLNDKYLIFASGVSNSKTDRVEEFLRERNLLQDAIQQNPAKHLVYFSSCSIDDNAMLNMPYVKHKLSMESLIHEKSVKYNIFRLSNVTGESDNPNTIVNYFYNHIINLQKFDLWIGAERNIIDISDAYNVMRYVIEKELFGNKVINVANVNNYKVTYIVNCIEEFLNIKANFDLKDKGSDLHNDVAEISPIFKQLNINFENNYFESLLRKYYKR